ARDRPRRHADAVVRWRIRGSRHALGPGRLCRLARPLIRRASFRCDNMKPMWKPAALAVVLTLAAATARAQISTTATPVYHGTLRILRPAVGTFDAATGNGTLRVRRWRLGLREDSNGIFPDQEPVVVALGEESFRLEAGSLTRSRNGKVFRYQAPHDAGPRGIRSIRIAQRARD